MSRRPNGAGSMYLRGNSWYSKMWIGGKWVRMSLKTNNESVARKRLDTLARGREFSETERLAALVEHLKPKNGKRTFEEAWDCYEHSPENVTQTDAARGEDHGVWKVFVRWLHGQSIKGSRTNCKAAHPEVDCLDEVLPTTAAQYITWLRDERSANTANKAVRILRRIWRLNGVAENPWTAFRKFKVVAQKRRAFTREEVEKIIGEADGELRVLFTIGAYTGLRMGDCQHLRYESIDGKAGVIRTGKTGKVVRIPIHPRLLKAIGRPKACGYILPVLATWPRWKLSNAVQDHLRKCGFEEPVKCDGYKKAMPVVGFHSLRSTFITWLGEAGIPLPVVRDMVGHVSEEMTMRYFRGDDEMAKRAIKALG